MVAPKKDLKSEARELLGPLREAWEIMRKKLPVVHPSEGGCWFCHRNDDEHDVLLFDEEFDTYVHQICLLSALADNKEEAQHMAYLLEELD